MNDFREFRDTRVLRSPHISNIVIFFFFFFFGVLTLTAYFSSIARIVCERRRGHVRGAKRTRRGVSSRGVVLREFIGLTSHYLRVFRVFPLTTTPPSESRGLHVESTLRVRSVVPRQDILFHFACGVVLCARGRISGKRARPVTEALSGIRKSTLREKPRHTPRRATRDNKTTIATQERRGRGGCRRRGFAPSRIRLSGKSGDHLLVRHARARSRSDDEFT